MRFRRIGQFRASGGARSFNMTPVIDIVFLLIIFLLVVCQFVEAENFAVAVPDNCEFAQDDSESGVQVTTVTVMKDSGKVVFAVGPQEIAAQDDAGISGKVERLAELIDARLKDLPGDERIVTLRIDKDIPFAQAQYALAAIAQSTATKIRMAVLSGKLPATIAAQGR